MAYIGSQPTKVVSQQSSRVYRYTATAGQTAFSGADVDNQVLNVTPSDVEVHMNGLLLDPTDYTATSSSITLGTAANAGDELTVTGMVTFEVADTYNKATADARYVDVAGDTMTGALNVDGVYNQSGDNDSGLDLSTNDVVAFKTANTERMSIDANGYVTKPNQPAFRAYFNVSSPAAYVSGSRLLDFTTVDHNIGGCYDGTNKFTAPVAGLYRFSCDRSLNTQGQDQVIRHPSLSFLVNGTAEHSVNVAVSVSNTGSSTSYSHFVSNIGTELYLNVNDYVQVNFSYNNSPHTLHEYARSYFSGYLVG